MDLANNNTVTVTDLGSKKVQRKLIIHVDEFDGLDQHQTSNKALIAFLEGIEEWAEANKASAEKALEEVQAAQAAQPAIEPPPSSLEEVKAANDTKRDISLKAIEALVTEKFGAPVTMKLE
jgi:hypothetical protein